MSSDDDRRDDEEGWWRVLTSGGAFDDSHLFDSRKDAELAWDEFRRTVPGADQDLRAINARIVGPFPTREQAKKANITNYHHHLALRRRLQPRPEAEMQKLREGDRLVSAIWRRGRTVVFGIDDWDADWGDDSYGIAWRREVSRDGRFEHASPIGLEALLETTKEDGQDDEIMRITAIALQQARRDGLPARKLRSEYTKCARVRSEAQVALNGE